MRRWSVALGLALTCLLLSVGASSPDARATSTKWNAPILLSSIETTVQPSAVVLPAPKSVVRAFGSYAVVGLRTIIITALLCYAVLQRRRATAVPHLQCVVRPRGPPILATS
ncbi:MAG TPA: hypothetical protein VL856_00455 [Acidimicrobiia bacterium]|nr:hypothetical protein [Acidimicrobiia bacterium]